MQELIFIGVIALMIFGPRKLPQMARTIGKAMAEFRRATSEFKETWQKEVDFEEFKDDSQKKLISPVENSIKVENSIAKNENGNKIQVIEPEIKEISQADFEQNFPFNKTENGKESQTEESQTAKQNWL